MSMKLTATVITCIFLASCASNSSPKEEVKTDSTKQEEKESVMNCYQYTSKADTVILRLLHIKDNITGVLVYKLDGKDKNKGTIQGHMQDSLFVANYSFISEGQASERQVAFKLVNGTFVEGHGESVTENDRVRFKDLKTLNFDGIIKLSPVKCE